MNKEEFLQRNAKPTSFFLINWNTKLEINPIQSVHRKYNLFFDLKTKRILKIFHFSISKQKLKQNWNEIIFWNLFFNFKSKNEFENFDFCFLKSVLNQNRFKKIFFRFSSVSSIIKFKKLISKFWSSFFVFWFETGLTKVCSKIELKLLWNWIKLFKTFTVVSWRLKRTS